MASLIAADHAPRLVDALVVVDDIRPLVVRIIIKHAAAAQNDGHDPVTTFIINAIFVVAPAHRLFDGLLSIVGFRTQTATVKVLRSTASSTTQKTQTAAKQILETLSPTLPSPRTIWITLFPLACPRIGIIDASSRVDDGCS